MDNLWSTSLANMPLRLRLLFTATLMTMGMGYLFALTNLGLAIGFTPVKIIEHYWGNEATQRAMAEDRGEVAETEVEEEEMGFDDFDAEEEPIMAVPSFESLVAEGHFHLLSYAMLFFICGFIVSFAELPAGFKYTLILAPFVGSVFDIWSILLTSLVGPGFVWMVMISGSSMALSFAGVFGVSIYQMWFLGSAERGEL